MINEYVAERIEAMNPVTTTSPHKVEQAWASFIETELAAGHRAGARRITLLGRQWSRFGLTATLALTASFAGVGIAAATDLLGPTPVTNLAVAHCYTLDQVTANGTDVAAVGAPGSVAQVDDALGTCQMLWRDGFLAAGAPRAIRVIGPITVHAVPSLVVCTMPNGTAAVFPGDDATCRTLGLRDALSASSGK
jgi:hypothetical protein